MTATTAAEVFRRSRNLAGCVFYRAIGVLYIDMTDGNARVL